MKLWLPNNKGRGIFLAILLLFFLVDLKAFSQECDVRILSVGYLENNVVKNLSAGVTYDPQVPRPISLRIETITTGNFCGANLAIKGIPVEGKFSVFPPLAIPRPDQRGLSWITSMFTIPAGLRYGRHTFEIKIIHAPGCKDTNPNNNSYMAHILLTAPTEECCDYGIEEVTLAEGRRLEEGQLYTPNFPSKTELAIKIRWNKIAPTYGIQCHNRLQIWGLGSQRLLLATAGLSNPDKDGIITVKPIFNLPKGLIPGQFYPFKIELLFSDKGCDCQAGNNSRTYNLKLVRMSGNDLMVNIIKLEKEWLPKENDWGIKVTFEVANVSGTETLYDVKVGVGFNIYKIINIDRLPPRKWVRKTHTITVEVPYVWVEVDPDDDIQEIREDNNKDLGVYKRDSIKNVKEK